ncbi:DNA-directed RNA polymerase subunit E'' [Candidatus Woesearchaeota archaeon]|nr:DNA-directed RNA polymerase subunit E'' [Candidatus Woesearchaeota archaeon]
MAKKLANKKSKELLSDSDIREKGLNKEDFTPTWNGRLYIVDPAKSEIAKKSSITKKGEYAIKVR